MTDKLDELLMNARVVELQPDDVVILELPDARPLSAEAAAVIRDRVAALLKDRRFAVVNGQVRIEPQPA